MPAIQTSLTWWRPVAYTSCETTWCSGWVSSSTRSTQTRSACLPGSIEPTQMLEAQRARAAQRGRAQRAGGVAARTHPRPPPWPAARRVRVSPNMSRSLLLAAPSVPIARFTPARRSLSTGQKPEASLRLDSGQCTTLTPRSAHSSISASVSWVMCTAIRRSLTRPSRSRRASGRWPCCCCDSATSCAVSCTWQCTGTSSWSASMRMRSKLASRHGVRRVRRERGCDQRIVAPLVVHFAGAVEIFVGRLRPGRGKVDHRQADASAEAVALVSRGLHVGEEVVLVAAGGAAAQHFGDGQGRRRRRRTPGRSPRPRSARCGPAATASAADRRRRRASGSSGCGCGR